MPNHHNPGRYRGGGAPIEFVRGGMGRGRRTSYFVNRSGRGTNMQHRNSLGAMPDCVPQSENYHHPDEQAQLQEGEDIGSGRQTEEVLGNLPTVYVADSGSGRQAEEVMCDLSTVHVPDSGLNAASPVPSIPVLSCVINDPHTGQNATNLMRPIPILQTMTALNQAMIGNSTVYAVGPVLPPEQTHNTVLIQNVIQATIPTEIQPSTTNDTYTEQNIIEVQNILEHSTLSPNAKEFVPLSKYKLSQLSSSDTYSKEVEMDSSNYNSSFLDTQEIFGSNDKENSDQMTTSNGAYGCKERLDDNLLENWSYTEMVETLQLVQCELIKHPASFNNMMRNITPALLQWLQSNLALPMVDFIISMATQQDNFSYMAARICIFVNNLDPSNVFRTNLIEKCHAICQNIGEERKCTSFLGFVMFLAELYVQFKNETGQRVDVIGTGLLECLENLISEPVVFDNLKFFCNALKLAGYYLDTNLNSAMNQLMTHIQSVMTAVGLDNMDKRIYNQLQRLIDMRNNNWDNQGAASLETQELDGTNNSNSATYSDAVFYGPDGQVLTLEESQFLNENQSLAECSQNECDEDSCKEDSGDSMDEEMQDAYEQFLQMVPEAR